MRSALMRAWMRAGSEKEVKISVLRAQGTEQLPVYQLYEKTFAFYH